MRFTLRPRRALLLALTIATVLLALPAASGARTHKSGCLATSTAHKSAVAKCAKPAHKPKPSHTPRRRHHKHKAKSHSPGSEAAEEASETICEEDASEPSTSEGSAVCEAPEEEQES
jgi:hypothetical protein